MNILRFGRRMFGRGHLRAGGIRAEGFLGQRAEGIFCNNP
jgi:hypothetical protein